MLASVAVASGCTSNLRKLKLHPSRAASRTILSTFHSHGDSTHESGIQIYRSTAGSIKGTCKRGHALDDLELVQLVGLGRRLARVGRLACKLERLGAVEGRRLPHLSRLL